MMVPYSKARKDIRDYCPSCVKEIFARAATGQDASVCPSCQKKEDPEKEAAPVGDAQ
jgi:ribosomal protein L37AE/L43A